MTTRDADILSIEEQTIFDRADSALDKGDYEAALELFGQLISNGKRSLKLYSRCGFSKYRAGQFREAIGDFDYIIEQRPLAKNTRFLRARCREEVGDLEDALEDYRAVILIDPNTADAYSNMAMIYEFKGDLGKAEELYKKAINVDPSDETAISGLQRIS